MAACPTGIMTKDNILELYDMPKQKAMVFINQIFKMFDKDGSGSISFRVGLEKCLCKI